MTLYWRWEIVRIAIFKPVWYLTPLESPGASRWFGVGVVVVVVIIVVFVVILVVEVVILVVVVVMYRHRVEETPHQARASK